MDAIVDIKTNWMGPHGKKSLSLKFGGNKQKNSRIKNLLYWNNFKMSKIWYCMEFKVNQHQSRWKSQAGWCEISVYVWI